MNQEQVLTCFAALGKSLSDTSGTARVPFIEKAVQQNPWFTKEFILVAWDNLQEMLEEKALFGWAKSYSYTANPKVIGIVAAGNIPLVAFHDILCVLVAGHKAKVKLSSKDKVLYSWLVEEIKALDAEVAEHIELTEEALKNIDAIIATGSNNTSRYFEYYFDRYPHIIRKNRNSLAVLDGTESADELSRLADDIFLFFGLGCRNVSFLLVPENYDFDLLFKASEKWQHLMHHHKYANNISYHRSVYLLAQEPFLTNDLLILKQQNTLASPIGVLNYQYYDNKKAVENFIHAREHEIQCVLSKTKWTSFTYPYGDAQKPALSDYADRMDVMQFLSTLN